MTIASKFPDPPTPQKWRTRFAPSPTGYLHLGHVVSAAWVWAFARRFEATVLLRIEDHDSVRSKKEFEDEIFEDLSWLGFFDLDDIEIVGRDNRIRQSDRQVRYREAVEELNAAGQNIFGCHCTRKQIKALSGDKHLTELFYSGTCRQRPWSFAAKEGVRLQIDSEQLTFDDLIHGHSMQQPSSQCGDLLLRDRDQNFSYQFAVTVDDIDQDINLIVRGDDLFESTGRQLLLAKKLGRLKPALFAHHPLVLDPLGSKLSKRQFSERIAKDRLEGNGPENVFRLAAQSLSIDNYKEIDRLDKLIDSMLKGS